MLIRIGNLLLPPCQPISAQIWASLFLLFRHGKTAWTDSFFPPFTQHKPLSYPWHRPHHHQIHYQEQNAEQSGASWRRKEQGTGTGCLLILPVSLWVRSEVNEKQEQRRKTRDSDCLLILEGALIPALRNLSVCWQSFCFLFKLCHGLSTMQQFDTETQESVTDD